MSNCRLCGKNTPVTCICGFCPECIAWKTHRGCLQEIERRNEDAKEKEENLS
jgi:hypothetical protein